MWSTAGGPTTPTGNDHVNFDWIENGVFIDKGVPSTTGVDKHRIEDIAKYDGTSNTLMLSENPNVLNGCVAAERTTVSQMLWFPEGIRKRISLRRPRRPRSRVQ